MKNLIWVVLIAVGLAGCETIKYVEVPVEVLVPVVEEHPEPPQINPPFLPTELLTPADKGNYEKVGRAYVESLKLEKNYSEKLERALDAYRKKPEEE